MATALQTRKDAAEGLGCLGRAADTEPVFVIRAHDRVGSAIVKIWACLRDKDWFGLWREVHDAITTANVMKETERETLDGAWSLASEMDAWNVVNKIVEQPEPTFTLRASDPLAATVVRMWAQLKDFDVLAAGAYYEDACNIMRVERQALIRANAKMPHTSPEVSNAIGVGHAMLKWQKEHPAK